MRINWSRRALGDLKKISDYIAQDSPDAAHRVVTRIYEQTMTLNSMADRGKPGQVSGTREIFFLPLPYFAVYRVVGEDVRILHLRHTSRRWPVKL